MHQAPLVPHPFSPPTPAITRNQHPGNVCGQALPQLHWLALAFNGLLWQVKVSTSAWATWKQRKFTPHGLITGRCEPNGKCSLCGVFLCFSQLNMHKNHLTSVLTYNILCPLPTGHFDSGGQGRGHGFAYITPSRWCQCSGSKGHTWRTILPCILYRVSETPSQSRASHPRNDQLLMCFCIAFPCPFHSPQSLTPVFLGSLPKYTS